GDVDGEAIACQHADAVLAQLARSMGEDRVVVVELDPEHGVGQQLGHHTGEFDQIFFGHPASVGTLYEAPENGLREGFSQLGRGIGLTSTAALPSPIEWAAADARGKEGPVAMNAHFRCGLLAALLLAPAVATAQAPTAPSGQTATSAITSPAQKTIGVPSQRQYSTALIVLNARSAKLDGQKLVLEGVMPSATLFTSRPVRTV